MNSGLVLFAHGARSDAWRAPLDRLAHLIAQRAPSLAVRTAFLELQTPDLATAIDELARSCDHISVLPVFWAAAGHVNMALPKALQAAQARHPECTFNALPPLSELPGLLDFLADTAVALSQT